MIHHRALSDASFIIRLISSVSGRAGEPIQPIERVNRTDFGVAISGQAVLFQG